jgi:hypothetical protein
MYFDGFEWARHVEARDGIGDSRLLQQQSQSGADKPDDLFMPMQKMTNSLVDQ